DGYVEVKTDGIVRLTPKGRETAYRTARRHHLIERMLSEIFDMDWYRIHDEAERLEHAVSPAFEEKLIKKLGEKGTCPHGNAVLPESPAQLKKRGLVPLYEAVENLPYIVTSLYERDPKLLVFLHRFDIGPNADVKVLARNYDQTVTVETPSGTTTLGRPAAEKVWVRRQTNKRKL